MAEMAKMSPKEIFQTIVDAGIYTPDGELAEPYRTPESEAMHEPASASSKKPRSKRPARTK